jgi:basic membrane lipoprotein Med (substrate-binding protein (PBP1-ABC) superfamily)
MVGSLVYNLYPIFKAIVKDVQSGKYKGKTYDLGLASFDLTLNSKYSAGKVPPAVLAKMNATKKAILAGKFKVPYIGS